MATPHYTYCRGNRCLLRSNCKRYLDGQRMPDSLLGKSDHHGWIDHCDEETRELFEPEKKSESE